MGSHSDSTQPSSGRNHGFAPHQLWHSMRALATGRPCLSDAWYRRWHLPWSMCRHNAGMMQMYFPTPSLPGWKKVVLSEKVEACPWCNASVMLGVAHRFALLNEGFGMDELPNNCVWLAVCKEFTCSSEPVCVPYKACQGSYIDAVAHFAWNYPTTPTGRSAAKCVRCVGASGVKNTQASLFVLPCCEKSILRRSTAG